ncbi:MAG: hypothetical protein ABFC57_06440 [Veillonellales bacterium]
MARIKKHFMLLLLFTCMTIVFLPIAAASAADSDFVKVTVNLTIENPEYFWQYPFLGKKIDRVCVSSMGEKQYIEAQSSGQIFEFNFPKDYQFRMRVELQNNNSVVNTLYFSKRGINETNNTFNILLKAPEPQSVVVQAQGFDETKTQ